MKVVKRNGKSENVDFNKITNRIRDLCKKINNSKNLDPIIVAQKVCNSLYDGVSTRELDVLSSEIAVSLVTKHLDYDTLAAHICINDLHKNTHDDYLETCLMLYNEKKVSTNS